VYTRMMRIRQQERNRRLLQARKAAENKRFVIDGLLISLFAAAVVTLCVFLYEALV